MTTDRLMTEAGGTRPDLVPAILHRLSQALAAIQGLNEKVEDRSQKSEVRIQKLEAENAELKQRLEALEKIIRNQKSD